MHNARSNLTRFVRVSPFHSCRWLCEFHITNGTFDKTFLFHNVKCLHGWNIKLYFEMNWSSILDNHCYRCPTSSAEWFMGITQRIGHLVVTSNSLKEICSSVKILHSDTASMYQALESWQVVFICTIIYAARSVTQYIVINYYYCTVCTGKYNHEILHAIGNC